MAGAKTVHGVDICAGPCCPGYEEIVDDPPLLSPVVYCRKMDFIRPYLMRPTVDRGDGGRPLAWYRRRK